MTTKRLAEHFACPEAEITGMVEVLCDVPDAIREGTAAALVALGTSPEGGRAFNDALGGRDIPELIRRLGIAATPFEELDREQVVSVHARDVMLRLWMGDGLYDDALRVAAE